MRPETTHALTELDSVPVYELEDGSPPAVDDTEVEGVPVPQDDSVHAGDEASSATNPTVAEPVHLEPGEAAAMPGSVTRTRIRSFMPDQLRLRNLRQIRIQAKVTGLKNSILPPGRQEEPGVVAPDPDGKFEVLSGSTRAFVLGEADLPFEAIVRDDLDTRLKRDLFIAATDVKSDRDPIEKALTVHACLEATGESQKVAARRWNMTEVQLSRLLAPLKMHPSLLAEHRANPARVTAAHLRELRKVENEAEQLKLLERVKIEGLSASELKEIISPKKPRGEKKSRMIQELLRHGAVLSYPDTLTPEQHKEVREEAKAKFDKRYEGVKATDLPVSAMPAKSK